MSLDYRVYAADNRPIGRAELVSAALAHGWHVKVLVNAAWDWSRYEICQDGELSTSDVAFGWETADENRALFERVLTAGDASGIKDACSDLFLRWANISIEEFDFARDVDPETQEALRSDVSEPTFELLSRAKVLFTVNFRGDGWFQYHLSRMIAEMRRGVWEDPQAGEFDLPGESSV